MRGLSTTRGWLRSYGCGLWLACACVCVHPCHASTSSKARPAAPLSPWERAAAARREFEAQPAAARTKGAYTRLLDQFRAVYHDAPRDLHAPAAVDAVAELLAEQGRQFDDQKSLRAAIGQYEFLRTQYPTSPLRIPALVAEGEIAKGDLGDDSLAQEKMRALIKEAPGSAAAREARAELAGAPAASAATASTQREVPAFDRASKASERPAPESVAARPGVAAQAPALQPAREVARKGPLAHVTGIRHWSTANYTRVAIDLGDEVTFEAARVPHPDRIFFDLHGAHLAQELIGKSFDVTDNGYLRRIRAAQQTADVTRVVLDVSGVSEYSAFLLPNPYRLIIDIHAAQPATTAAPRQQATLDYAGRPDGATTRRLEVAPVEAAPVETTPVTSASTTEASRAASRSGLPAMAPTTDLDALTATQPSSVPTRHPDTPAPAVARSLGLGHPVPNTVAVAAPAATTEMATLSNAPGRIDATPVPTSKPITARVSESRSKGRAATAAVEPGAPAKAARKTADGETSLVRALGLKINRIVIDAGHGGHDSGTLGVDGIEEKDVVLDVALRLGKLLHDRLGAEIIYTRSDDTFIPLETRTAIANKAQADLFLSIHANSSPDASARGVEVYYLNFTSDPTALDVAARENAVSGQSVHQLSDLVKKITLKDKIDESREFAADVDGSLYGGLTRGNDGLKNRGVKKAPFVVLIGANMPSILAEISFVTNPRDAAELHQPEYRERVAESLFNGVARYENGLAGARPAAAAVRAANRLPED